METVGDDLDAPLVADGRVEVHISQAHVPCNPRASFATHTGERMLEREGSRCQHAGGGARRPVVAERVEQPAAAAVTWRTRRRSNTRNRALGMARSCRVGNTIARAANADLTCCILLQRCLRCA